MWHTHYYYLCTLGIKVKGDPVLIATGRAELPARDGAAMR
jgi:hypothetical protein